MRKWLSLFLALTMLVSGLSLPVLAEDEDEGITLFDEEDVMETPDDDVDVSEPIEAGEPDDTEPVQPDELDVTDQMETGDIEVEISLASGTVITAVPDVDRVDLGDTVVIRATAANTTGSLTWQWQKSTNNGSTWTSSTLPGNKTDTLTFEATASRLAAVYRVRVIDDNGTWYSKPVFVSSSVLPTVVAEPEEIAVLMGEEVEFTATAKDTAGSLTWRWQKSTDGGETWGRTTLTGNATDTLTFEVTASRAAAIYRCAVTDRSGTWYSNTVKVIALPIPSVTVSGPSGIVFAGDTLTFTAAAANTFGEVRYQWQKSADGIAWSSTTLDGNTTAELSFTATASRCEKQYRCAVTDANGTWYSNAVSMTMIVRPTVTAAPKAVTAVLGAEVAFTATAKNTAGSLKWQWQKSTNGGETWGNTTLTGNATDTLSFEVTTSRAAAIYRCAVTDANGTWYSNTVQVTALPKPAVTVTASATTAFAGDTVTFTASAVNTTGTVRYQWQKSADGTTWSNTTLEGNDTAVLSFDATAARCDKKYRCAVTDASGTWYSKSVSVKLIARPTVTAKAAKSAVTTGDTVSIKATVANGVGTLTYAWQRSTNGTSWSSFSYGTYTAATLTFSASSSYCGYQYRCAVTDKNGTWYSDGVTVTFVAKPTISVKASTTKVTSGTDVTVTATVTGLSGEPTFQWQRSKDGGTTWANTTLEGNATSVLSFAATEARAEAVYRCAVKYSGFTWYSSTVSFTYITPASVTVSANADYATDGTKVTFTATATGTTGSLSYTWQKSADGTNWTAISGATAKTYTITATAALLAYKYRCTVKDSNFSWSSAGVKVPYITPATVTATPNVTKATTGMTVTFTASASGTSGTLSYQWQRSTDGSTWSNITEAVSKTYSVAATSSSMNYRYRVIVYDAHFGWTSAGVKVTWVTPATITAKTNVSVATTGDAVTCTVTTSNTSGTLSYKWQRSADGETWGNTTLDGNDTKTLSFEATKARLSYYYRCAVTDNNFTWYSNAVYVEHFVKPVIQIKPNGDTVLETGDYGELTSTYSNLSGIKSYKWQYSTSGSSWNNITTSNSWMYSMSIDSLVFKASQTTCGYYYRLSITDEHGTWYSDPYNGFVYHENTLVTSITLNYTSYTVNNGSAFSLTATVSPSTAANKTLTWSSNNTTVATVTSSGYVTGLYPGTATITAAATDGSGKKATCTVTVRPVYRALLVGNANYTSASKLPACLNDSNRFATALRSKKGANGATWNVTVKNDQTASGILNAITSVFSSARNGDIGLFFYSGHGAGTSSETDPYRGALVGIDSTYVTTANLANQLNKYAGTFICLFDSCYSGNFIAAKDGEPAIETTASDFNDSIVSAFAAVDNGVIVPILVEEQESVELTEEGEGTVLTVVKAGELKTSKYYVMTAATLKQTSKCNSTYSYFAQSLTDGIGSTSTSMPADSNGNSILTFAELFAAAYSDSGQTKCAWPSTTSSFVICYK